MGADLTKSHIKNHTKLEIQDLHAKRDQAALIDWFYEKEDGIIKGAVKEDLAPIKDTIEINKMKLITFNEFLPAFMRQLIHVYDSSPVYKWVGAVDEEGKKVDEPEDMTKLRALLDEVDMTQALRNNLIQARLHNTVFAEPKHNADLDKMFIETYNVGTAWVEPHPEVFNEWDVFAYEVWNKGSETHWIVWDRRTKEYYKFETNSALPKFDAEKRLFDGNKFPVGDNENTDAPNYGGEQRPPYVMYRYDQHKSDFWGNGMIAIVDLIRVVNVLCTLTNNDTLLQTMRLLLLNFEPSGTEDSRGKLKTGMEHPITSGNATPGNQVDPKADIISGDLFTDDVIKFIDSLMDTTANMFDIENPMRSALQETLSGIALRIRAEPLMRNWSEDILRVKNPDRQLIRSLIDVNNLNRSKNHIKPEILDDVIIDYMVPSVVKDEIGEYELERKRWADGTSNPVLWVMRENQEMTAPEAEEFIKNNKEITKALRGSTINLQRTEDAE